MSVGSCWATTTSTSSPPAPGRRRWTLLKEQQFDCVVLDLRLPDISGFELLEQMRDEPQLADVPVVVFTGKELTPEEDAQLQELARKVVIKGVESPERLLDETSLFLHRVIADLPADKQEMLERLHRSDEDLHGRKVLVVDDDVRNIFALGSVLERHGMKVVDRPDRAGGHRPRWRRRRTSPSC